MASRIADIIQKHKAELLASWTSEQTAAVGRRDLGKGELEEQCGEFLTLLHDAAQKGDLRSIEGAQWDPVKELLATLSRSRSQQGYSSTETALFVFSLKKPLFARLAEELRGDELTAESWTASLLLDQLGLFTAELYLRSRDELIKRQQQDMLELSTPVVKLWDGVLALPMIGTLDSQRTQVVMESLLQRIVETGSQVAILDITGVPTVDTLVAQHLLKTVAAARLMGADCIISGIRPQIAQTIVHLGVDLGSVSTKATLADAFKLALSRAGLTIARAQKKPQADDPLRKPPEP